MSAPKLIVVDKKGRAFRPCRYTGVAELGYSGYPCWVNTRTFVHVIELKMKPYEFYVLSESAPENPGDKSDIEMPLYDDEEVQGSRAILTALREVKRPGLPLTISESLAAARAALSVPRTEAREREERALVRHRTWCERTICTGPVESDYDA